MPATPGEPEFASAAERAAWEQVRAGLGPDDALFTSTRFTDVHGDHEGDLILALAGAGIAVIEVKGGRVEHNGTDWVQHGGTSKRIHPVDQARRVKYALRDYLDRQDAWGRRRVRMAHLVAFPYSTIPRGLDLPDCPRWMVLDKNDLSDGPCTAVRRALDQQDSDVPAATTADVRALEGCLPGAVHRVTSPPASPRRRRWWVMVAAVVALVVAAGLVAGVLLQSRKAAAKPNPASSPRTQAPGQLDPRFTTCLQAKAAGYGPYVRDRDPEYAWYHDYKNDGVVCS